MTLVLPAAPAVLAPVGAPGSVSPRVTLLVLATCTRTAVKARTRTGTMPSSLL